MITAIQTHADMAHVKIMLEVTLANAIMGTVTKIVTQVNIIHSSILTIQLHVEYILLVM